MADAKTLANIRSQFHSVQQSEGFRLLLALAEGERQKAQSELAECSADSLLQAQATLKAWSQVCTALGTEDGGGTVQSFLDTIIERKSRVPARAPSLRIPGNNNPAACR